MMIATNAPLEAEEYRQLLFASQGRGFLYRFSRLQAVFEDFADRLLSKSYINLETNQSRILMALALRGSLSRRELQQQTGLSQEQFPGLLGGLIGRGLLRIVPAGALGEGESGVQLSAGGAAILERVQRLLRKAEEMMFQPADQDQLLPQEPQFLQAFLQPAT